MEQDGDWDDLGVTLSSGEWRMEHLLGEIRRGYRQGLHCDAEVLCQDGARIPCHGLVLAAASSTLAEALEGASSAGDGADGRLVLLAPGHPPGQVRHLLDHLHFSACDFLSCCERDPLPESILMDFGVNSFSLPPEDSPDDVTDPLNTELFQPVVKLEKLELEECEKWIKPEIKNVEGRPRVKLKRGRKRKAESTRWLTKINRIKKHKKLTVVEETRKIPDVDDRTIEAQVEHLESLFRDGQGHVTVNLVNEGGNPSCPRNSNLVRFMGLAGIQKRGDADSDAIVATPIAWSTKEDLYDSVLTKQFTTLGNLLKDLYGFSDFEVFAHKALLPKLGLRRNFMAYSLTSYRNQYASKNPDEVREILKRPDLVAAAATTDKCKKDFGSEDDSHFSEGDVSLLFDGTAEAGSCQDLVLITYTCKGALTAQRWQFDPQKNHKLTWIRYHLALFFDVAVFWKGASLNPPKHGIKKLFERVYQLRLEHRALQDCLANPGLEQKEEGKDVPTEQCPVCGEVFSLGTSNNRARFARHKEDHEIADFKCDCEFTWRSLREKKFHVLLVHRNEDNMYSKCDLCHFVGTRNQIEGHVLHDHEPTTCEHCGETRNGTEKLKQHVMRRHPEHMTERMKRRKNNSGGVCSLCGVFYTELSRHIKIKHHKSQECTCEICGMKFTVKTSYNRHMLNMHAPKEDLKHGCDKCQKRFGKSVNCF